MLLSLPKDVLRYILSIVVYDTLVEHYSIFCERTNSVSQNISLLTSTYSMDCRFTDSKMAAAVKCLSLVHPSIHRLLVDVSEVATERVFYSRSRYWKFNASFFVTLLR